MDGRSATGAAIAVVVIGIVAFFMLDGVAAGVALLVAGLLLVVIGVVGWQEPQPAAATAGTPTSSADGPQAMHGEAVPDPSGADRRAATSWRYLSHDAERTRDLASDT